MYGLESAAKHRTDRQTDRQTDREGAIDNVRQRISIMSKILGSHYIIILHAQFANAMGSNNKMMFGPDG